MQTYLDDLNLNYLSKEFVEGYRDIEPPFGQIGAVVYLRTYSRYLPKHKRREFWYETVARVVDYSISLDIREKTPQVLAELKEEAKELYDHIFNLKIYPAGRTLWVGGSEETKKDGIANFNCSTTAIDSIESYPEMMYLLMVGAGTGFTVEKRFTDQLPQFYKVPVKHLLYKARPKFGRLEYTEVKFDNGKNFNITQDVLVNIDCKLMEQSLYKNAHVTIFVGDSKAGWTGALRAYLKLLTSPLTGSITFDYSSIRPEGERLKRMGGRASGYLPLQNTFQKILWTVYKAIDTNFGKLKPVWAMDLANFIAEAIVCGGVRRSSEICFFDLEDVDMMEAKTGLWSAGIISKDSLNSLEATLKDAGYQPNFEKLVSLSWSPDFYLLDEVLKLVPDFSLWSTDSKDLEIQKLIDSVDDKYRYRASRVMSNNSVHLWQKPSHEDLSNLIHHIAQTGEPGLANAYVASKRRPNYVAGNPCFEILMDKRGLCNLTDTNVLAYVKEPDSFDYEGYSKAVRLATRMGSRMTNVELWHPLWSKVQKRDRLLGVSMTGLVEAFDKLGWGYSFEGGSYTYKNDPRIVEFEKQAKQIARQEADYYHEQMGIPRSLLVTCVKPAGTLSQLSTISSGAHRPYAPYYLRRIRVSKVDPVAKALKDMGIPVSPENAQGNDLYSDICNTWVFSFPVKTNAPVRAIDEKAVDQLERYKSLMDHYVEHNVSYTCTVAPHEWDEVAEWLLDNWDSYVGISFLPRFDPTEATSPYPQLPYETLTKEQYEEMAANMPYISEKEFNQLISKYEQEYEEFDLGADCDTGFCPIR